MCPETPFSAGRRPAAAAAAGALAEARAKSQGGLSLMEIVVALAIMSIAGFLFAIGYKSLARGTADVSNTTGMQTLVKSLGRQIEGDVKRAGFGLGGAGAFSTLGTAELALNYKDLLGTSCAAGQTASVRYRLEQNALARQVSCNGTAKPKQTTPAGRDSLILSFRYLNNAGVATAVSNQVRTVEYTVEVVSGLGPVSSRKRRSSNGSVSIVNNG